MTVDRERLSKDRYRVKLRIEKLVSNLQLIGYPKSNINVHYNQEKIELIEGHGQVNGGTTKELAYAEAALSLLGLYSTLTGGVGPSNVKKGILTIIETISKRIVDIGVSLLEYNVPPDLDVDNTSTVNFDFNTDLQGQSEVWTIEEFVAELDFRITSETSPTVTIIPDLRGLLDEEYILLGNPDQGILIDSIEDFLQWWHTRGNPVSLSQTAPYEYRRQINVELPVETESGFTQIQKLVAEDGDSTDLFGSKVALDGNQAIIGAPADEDPHGDYAGSAYIFERIDNSWTQQAKLTATDGDSSDLFGWPVALDGDRALIGARSDEDPHGDSAGSAYVFEKVDDSWTQQTKLTADDGESGDRFGWALALDGHRAIIGVPGDETEQGETGSVYVFENSGDSWTEKTKLKADNGNPGDEFGLAIGLDGDRTIIGAGGEEADTGAAYVFEQISGSWFQQAKLTADDRDSNDIFGWETSLDGDRVIIGAIDEDSNGAGSGSAYAFEFEDGSWTQQAKLIPDDGASGDHFGWAVSLDGARTIISAPWNQNPNGDAAGKVYVFDLEDDSWVQQSKLTADDGDPHDRFGYSVALSADRALIGADNDENPNGSSAGAAYLFEL